MLRDRAVLIVEDNIFLALDLSSVVETNEGRVAGPVATAADALSLIESDHIGAAVIGCDLIDHQVVQIVMHLAERQIPVVFSTTTSLPPEVARILPDAPVLLKPIQANIVVAQLAEQIANQSRETT